MSEDCLPPDACRYYCDCFGRIWKGPVYDAQRIAFWYCFEGLNDRGQERWENPRTGKHRHWDLLPNAVAWRALGRFVDDFAQRQNR